MAAKKKHKLKKRPTRGGGKLAARGERATSAAATKKPAKKKTASSKKTARKKTAKKKTARKKTAKKKTAKKKTAKKKTAKKKTAKKKTAKKKTAKKKTAKKKQSLVTTDETPPPRKQLRILRMQEADPGQRRFSGGLLGRADFAVAPCKGCDSRCCGLRAYMSIPEAVRMAFVLGVPLTFFIEVAIEGEDLTLDERWGGALLVDGGRAQLSFLRDPETKVCRHVVRPGEKTSHCGVYSLRPGICRLYPYNFEAPDGTELQVGTQDRCPVFWLFTEDARAQLERDWEAWRADMAVDQVWVDKWNDPARADRSVAALFEWLSSEAAVGLGHHPEDLEPFVERSFGGFRKHTRRPQGAEG